MSFRDPRVLAWEKQLQHVFDEIDHIMEDRYGDRYPLHPNRPPRGATSNPSADGLFDLGAAFTAGFGSIHGRGYVVQIRLSTLARIPAEVIEQIEQEILELLREKLPKAFPCRSLSIERDGHSFKIVGDLSIA
ncbi:MAG TPA: hypothetical protein PKE55_07435 [Kiritimatiellia bacterium]|nr:hypothetical protein [Kiritimatiellia bacterium]